MGYQEAWLTVKPKSTLIKVLELSLQAHKDELLPAYPASVVVLKQNISGLWKGTVAIWVVGERSHLNLADEIAEHFPDYSGYDDAEIYYIESIWRMYEGIFDGLELDEDSKDMTENKYMKRYNPHEFLRLVKTGQKFK